VEECDSRFAVSRCRRGTQATSTTERSIQLRSSVASVRKRNSRGVIRKRGWYIPEG